MFPISLRDLVAGAFGLAVVVSGGTWAICNLMHDQSDKISQALDTKLDDHAATIAKAIRSELAQRKSNPQGQ